MNGPAAVLFTYLTELHGPKYRAHVLLVVGMITSTSTLLLPMLAWGIFPRPWDFVIFDVINSKFLYLHSLLCFYLINDCFSSQLADLPACLCPAQLG